MSLSCDILFRKVKGYLIVGYCYKKKKKKLCCKVFTDV